MAAARRSRRELTDDVQGSSGGSGAEAAASPVEDAVAANVLEHYIRFRSKAEDASFKGWLELLELTMPKLERRRGLLEIDKATRLCYVMMLVGTGRDPALASRAIAAMLVDHWCDKGPCAFLQKDAIRHATVVDGEYSEGLDKESIAQQLEAGVEDALDGTGLEGLGVFADWRRDRDILCPGGAASLREEIMGVAQRCRDTSNNLDALSILEEYTEERRMGTFEDDFMAWGRVQLEKLPATIFDRAGFATSAPPSTPDAKKSNSAEGGGSAASGSLVGESSGRRERGTPVRDSSRAARRIVTPITDSSNEDDSGSRRRGGVGNKPLSSAPPGLPRVSPSTSRNASGADDHGSGSKATTGSGARVAVSGSREQPLSLDDDGSDDSASSSENCPSARQRKDGHEHGGDLLCSSASGSSDDDELEDEYFPSDSSKRLRLERKKQRRKRRKKRHLDFGGVVPAAASLEEEAAKAVAAMEAARPRPRRAGKRNQGELVEGDQVILEAKEFGRPTNWVPGVVTCNRKDGTYDVFLAGGEVARLVRRVELHYRHGGGARAGARSSMEARPDGCPAAVFGSADVIDVSPGAGAEEAGGGEAGGGAGAGAGAGRRGTGRPRLSKVYRRVGGKVDAAEPSDDEGVREEQEEGEEEGEEKEEWEKEEEEEEEEEDHTGETRRAAPVSAHAGSGGSGSGRRRTRTMTSNTESGDDSDNGESRGNTREAEERKQKAVASSAAGGGASGGDGNSKGKGKGPARRTNTDRRSRVSVVDLAGDSPAASPTRAASATTAGLRAVRTRSPVRSSVSQASRPASGRFYYYESVSEDDDDSSSCGDERRPVRSDTSVKRPPARLNRSGGGGGRREKRSEAARAVGWQANTASGNDGDNDGVTSSPAASSGGERHGERGRVSGGGWRDKAAAGKFPTDSEIAAHKEGGTGWGGDCASDLDSSSSSGSDAAAPRSRRPRKGKARS
ncbi:unnamed protein product [Ectocarpus sp. 4 AP-2014]